MGSTVNVPNSEKGIAAGAETSGHKPQWIETRVGDDIFKTDGGNLDTLQLKFQASFDLDLTGATGGLSALDKNVFSLREKNWKALLGAMSELHEPDYKIELTEHHSGDLHSPSFFRKGRILITGWRDVTDAQREAYQTAVEDQRQKRIAAAEQALRDAQAS